MNFLLDTNVVSELRRGRNAAASVVAWFATINPERVFTSVIVLGEIRRGIELIARRDQFQARALERWYTTVRRQLGERVLVIDEAVMTNWARITVPNMMAAYDGLIAATALVHRMTVVSRNVTDYRRAGLNVINPWVDKPSL